LLLSSGEQSKRSVHWERFAAALAIYAGMLMRERSESGQVLMAAEIWRVFWQHLQYCRMERSPVEKTPKQAFRRAA
jgi:hypothetical protein